MRRLRSLLFSGVMAAVACCGLVAGVMPANAGIAEAAAAVGDSWGNSQEVRGLPNWSSGPFAQVSSVSCASAGDCAAGGMFARPSGNQAFVVSETGGSWGKAEEVPGTAAINTGQAAVSSVWCASPGNCAAGGYYNDAAGQQAFVVSETGGSWGKAVQVAGNLNTFGNAAVNSVSCASSGNCAAGGYYYPTGAAAGFQAFVIDESGGSWGKAEEVPGTAALNVYGNAAVSSISCASPGNCAAGGYYADHSGLTQAFVADESSGSWGTAQEVAAVLNAGHIARVNSVSCGSAGNCAAGGYYHDSSGASQAFVIDEAGGSWGTAQEVAGALNTGGSDFLGDAAVSSVSCPSAGTCAAGGHYTDSSGSQAFVIDETAGSWAAAEELPGTAALNTGEDAAVSAVSCPSPGICAAGGYYKANAYGRPLVAKEAQATSTTLSLSAPTVTYGKEQAERLSVTVTPQHSGNPAGTVAVKTGATTICTITLASAKGSCTLTARQLSVGTHTLTAAYSGNGYYLSSASAKKTLTVVK